MRQLLVSIQRVCFHGLLNTLHAVIAPIFVRIHEHFVDVRKNVNFIFFLTGITPVALTIVEGAPTLTTSTALCSLANSTIQNFWRWTRPKLLIAIIAPIFVRIHEHFAETTFFLAGITPVALTIVEGAPTLTTSCHHCLCDGTLLQP